VSSQIEPEVKRFVLDSWAMLAYLQSEPGHERILELLRQAEDGGCGLAMTWVNLGEVLYIVERERGLSAAQNVLAQALGLPVEMIDADRNLVLAASHLKARLPISYADCFVLALAQLKKAVVLTGDPEFKKAEGKFSVEWLNNADVA